MFHLRYSVRTLLLAGQFLAITVAMVVQLTVLNPTYYYSYKLIQTGHKDVPWVHYMTFSSKSWSGEKPLYVAFVPAETGLSIEISSFTSELQFIDNGLYFGPKVIAVDGETQSVVSSPHVYCYLSNTRSFKRLPMEPLSTLPSTLTKLEARALWEKYSVEAETNKF